MPPERRSTMGAIARRALLRLEEAAGQPVEVAGHRMVPAERVELLEAVYEDHRVLQREVELMGYGLFDFANNQPQEIATVRRRQIVQRARFIWANDPQAGASVELMNDFCFGRGVPRPRCKDKALQEIVDEAWDDPDNQEVLTTLEAQLALGVDLSIQSNVFILLFEGDDGKVKLSILRHDDVSGVVPDPEKRHRALYYIATHRRIDWDYETDQPVVDPSEVAQKPFYYEHWRNVELAKEERGREEEFKAAPADRVKEGRVYHVRINRGSEQIFGVPRFQRTLRWYTAYNDYVKDRLDIVKAAASLIMKNKAKGTPQQIERQATTLLARTGPLSAGGIAQAAGMAPGPRGAGGMWFENDTSTLEPLNLSTRAGEAQADAQIIRAPIAAAERWTQAYFGDASNSNLATATSLELPILKLVESRQEVWEGLFRWFIDRVIEQAVDSGRISKELGPDEMPDDREERAPEDLEQALLEACVEERDAGRELVEIAKVKAAGSAEECWLVVSRDESQRSFYTVVEAYQDQSDDERDTERDLSYEFSMPSPLRRMMSDLITAITSLAQTFDPNNTNPEFSRILLSIALGEGLEVQNAPEVVEKAFPKGYVDPAVAAQYAAQGLGPDGKPVPGQQSPTAGFGNGDAGQPFPTGPDGNPYGAPMQARTPDQLQRVRSGPYAMSEAAHGVTRGRDGREVIWEHPARLELMPGEPIEEAPLERLDEVQRAQLEGRRRDIEDQYRRDVLGPAMRELDALEASGAGGG